MIATSSPAILIHRIGGAFFLPPMCFIWLALLGVYFKRRWMIFAALLMCYILSTPRMALLLTAPLEVYPVLSVDALQKVDAIVVLGGGAVRAPEYGGDDVGAESLARVRYAAFLARNSGKPILLTGGCLPGEPCDAPQMARALERDFGLRARWQEAESTTTLENAQFSARLLRPAGVKRIALVSNAWHLRRAVPFFRVQGFEVLPAPTGFISINPDFPLPYVPTGFAMQQSWTALREWLGILFYTLPH